MPTYRSASGSSAEDLFIELFSDTFGAEKAGYLYSQYPFSDIYQNSRFADFLIENGGRKVAIEIDDEASHNPKLVSQNKFYDDLLKQNSMIYLGWDVYRWAVRQMQQQPETVKDELRVFLGQHPNFKEIEDYLPTQRGKSLDGSKLELKEHQKQALAALEEMRCSFETIALLYHATGTGKTVTAVMDAKRFGKRTLFLAHTVELVDQATKTFRELWPRATVGRYVESMKQGNAFVVCGSIQSVALNLERFKPDDFGYIIVDEAHHASADTYQKVLSYFTPEFTLGLTATPERADDKNILDIFKNTAHKLDIQTAVEIGELVPVRCIRIHTNIDLTKVRFNSVQYNIRDLESKIYGKTQAVRRRHGPKAGGRPLGGPHRGGPQTKRRAHLPVCPGQNPEGTAGQAPPGPGGLSGCGAHRGQPHDSGRVAGPVDGGLRRGHPAPQHPTQLRAIHPVLHQALSGG
mgnify:CR=1 FL=1